MMYSQISLSIIPSNNHWKCSSPERLNLGLKRNLGSKRGPLLCHISPRPPLCLCPASRWALRGSNWLAGQCQWRLYLLLTSVINVNIGLVCWEYPITNRKRSDHISTFTFNFHILDTFLLNTQSSPQRVWIWVFFYQASHT
jgi:hypothetical protein